MRCTNKRTKFLSGLAKREECTVTAGNVYVYERMPTRLFGFYIRKP